MRAGRGLLGPLGVNDDARPYDYGCGYCDDYCNSPLHFGPPFLIVVFVGLLSHNEAELLLRLERTV